MNAVEEISKNDVLKFKIGEAGDSKDFIIFILEQFHKELGKSIKTKDDSVLKHAKLLRQLFDDFVIQLGAVALLKRRQSRLLAAHFVGYHHLRKLRRTPRLS